MTPADKGVRTMLIQCLAIAAIVAAVPVAAGAQNIGTDSQAANDAMQIKLINAQIHALQAYTGCLERVGAGNACQPPRPLQLPSLQTSSSSRPAHMQAMIDSARHGLIAAEARAMKAHGQCVRKQPRVCGPSP